MSSRLTQQSSLRTAARRLLAVLSVAVLAACTGLLVSDMGWWGLAVSAFAMGAGTWARRRWIELPRLRKAEAAWASGAPASEGLALGPPVGGGEQARQIHLLRGRVFLALGYRDSAWAAYREADLARLPWPLRTLARRLFRALPERPSPLRMK